MTARAVEAYLSGHSHIVADGRGHIGRRRRFSGACVVNMSISAPGGRIDAGAAVRQARRIFSVTASRCRVATFD